MVNLFWYLTQKIDLNSWVERVGADYNPSDMPVRHVALPFPVDRPLQFPKLTTIFQLIQQKSRPSMARRIKETEITPPR